MKVQVGGPQLGYHKVEKLKPEISRSYVRSFSKM